MDKSKIKRSIFLSCATLVMAATAYMSISNHSHIRTVELISILAVGMGIGALITGLTQLALYNKIKRGKNDLNSID